MGVRPAPANATSFPVGERAMPQGVAVVLRTGVI
jgi:hypothetical protein